MYEFWTELKIHPKKIPKNFFLLFFWSKSQNGGEIHEFEAWNNHEIAGITNFEITKCGDPLYDDIQDINNIGTIMKDINELFPVIAFDATIIENEQNLKEIKSKNH